MATEFYVFADFIAQGGTDADLFTLEQEVRAVGGGLETKFDYSEKTPAGAPTGVTFTFSSALTAPEQASLDGVVAAHQGTVTVPPPPTILVGTPIDGQIYVYDSGASPSAGFVNVTMSGDATIDETGAVTIPNFTAVLDGFAPASGGGTTNFLRADGTWIAPPQPTFGAYQGTFDASVGTFPVTANTGDWFNTTVAGTVDGETFGVGDLLIAIVDAPSTTTFAGNWTRVPNISAGDVVGPASATDNAVALYDGTTGKMIKNSLVTIDGAGNISTPGTVDGFDISSLDANLATFTVPANTTISAFGASLVDDADAATARATLGVDPAGTDNSTDVTLAGTPDYITISGQVITRNQIDLTTDVTGLLPIANGGTGAANAADARTNLGVDPAGTDNSTDVTLAGEDYLSIAGQLITANPIDLDNLSATGTPDSTTFLRGDNTWQVVSQVFGSEFEESYSAGQQSTTSGVYITPFSFTTAVVPAGDYRIDWFCDAGSDTDKSASHRLTIDGTEEANIEFRIKEGVEGDGIAWTAFSGHRIVTLTNAAHTIAFQYRADNTAYIRRKQISIYRVA